VEFHAKAPCPDRCAEGQRAAWPRPRDYHLGAIAAHVYFLPDIYRRDPALLRALDEEFEFVPPAGYEESLSGAP
jgi:hypothetical protein